MKHIINSSFAILLLAAVTLLGVNGKVMDASPVSYYSFLTSPLSTPQSFRSPLLTPTPKRSAKPLKPKPLHNDAMVATDNIQQSGKSAFGLMGTALTGGYGPTAMHTSDYMLGSVAVAIILPESDGSFDPSTENWTDPEVNQVYQEVVSGLNWWKIKAQARGITTLGFIIPAGYPIKVNTKYEPISRPGAFPSWGSQEGLWIDEVMAKLGIITTRQTSTCAKCEITTSICGR